MQPRMEIVPMTLAEANEFVRRYHRHHGPVVGAKFAVGLALGEEVIGVAIVGRPVSRALDDGWTLEVTRCCVKPGAPKGACSKLYARCWQIVRLMGYRRLVTYTLPSESGASLRGAGWKCIGVCGGGTWNRRNRPRVDKHPLGLKLRWEKEA